MSKLLRKLQQRELVVIRRNMSDTDLFMMCKLKNEASLPNYLQKFEIAALPTIQYKVFFIRSRDLPKKIKQYNIDYILFPDLKENKKFFDLYNGSD